MKIQIGWLAMTLGIMVSAVVAHPADAQTVNPKATGHARWYNAPHEIQIIDDRPVVRDFREAPQAPAGIQLPPGPNSGPGFSGGGAGAMGGGDGNGTIPDNM